MEKREYVELCFRQQTKNPRDLSHEMNSFCINYRYLVDKIIFFIIIYGGEICYYQKKQRSRYLKFKQIF